MLTTRSQTSAQKLSEHQTQMLRVALQLLSNHDGLKQSRPILTCTLLGEYIVSISFSKAKSTHDTALDLYEQH